MNFLQLSELENLDQLYEIWNAEYKDIFPITKELFTQNLTNYYDKASFVCLDENQVVGFVIGKTWQEDYIVKGYENYGWISLIYVKPNYRKQGIGTMLLSKAESVFRDENKVAMNLGRDCKNYFPGLPVDYAAFRGWFEKRGFDCSGLTYDLISKKPTKLQIENENEFKFRIGTLDDKDAIIAFLNRVWPGRWTWEAVEYFKNGGDGSEYMLCFNKDNEICAFSKVCNPKTLQPCISYSLTWRDRFEGLGGVGPLGVDPEYRKKHLGYDIVSSAVNYLWELGTKEIIIDWTGLLEFYRHMGFEVWKAYFYMSKNLQ